MVCPGFTTTVITVGRAHSVTSGVNVYVVVVVLSIIGLQVPEIPLFDVFGKVKLAPAQIGGF